MAHVLGKVQQVSLSVDQREAIVGGAHSQDLGVAGGKGEGSEVVVQLVVVVLETHLRVNGGVRDDIIDHAPKVSTPS